VPVPVSYQDRVVPAEILETLATQPMRLSPTRIRRFRSCPYSFLLSAILDLDAIDWGYIPDNALALGLAIHSAVEMTLANGDVGVDACARALATAFRRPETRIVLPRRAEAEMNRYYASALATVLADETLGLDSPGRSEVELTYETDRYTLRGYADRLIGPDDDGATTIVDFKLGRGSIPSLAAVADGREIQLPLYRFLTERVLGERVERIAYVAIRDTYIGIVADPNGTGRDRARADQIEEVVAAIPSLLDDIADRVEAGDFRCGDDADCSQCGMRSICRRCYVTRRYGVGA
jgi:ATP-dependent helicase/DNAse subunit B